MDRLPPQLGKDGRIIEGILTTLNEDNSVNIAPMGPIVDPAFSRFVLRPFQTSTSFSNLLRTKQAVFHVTDNIELIARAAIDCMSTPPETSTALRVDGQVLQNACRWYELSLASIDTSAERAVLEAHCLEKGFLREFVGFNRAQHATLEAAILATRVHILEPVYLQKELERLGVIVTKTAGAIELRAFNLLRDYIENSTSHETTPSIGRPQVTS